eukprot:1157921-Pelagomonas_calceolata.AAC.6
MRLLWLLLCMLLCSSPECCVIATDVKDSCVFKISGFKQDKGPYLANIATGASMSRGFNQRDS